MTAITGLTEDFTSGNVGDAVAVSPASIFTAITAGGSSATIITDPYDSTRRMMQIIASANNKSLNIDLAQKSTIWFRFDLDIVTPFDSNTAIINGYDVTARTNKVFDVQIAAGARQLRLRDNNTMRATSPVLQGGFKHRIYIKVQCSTTAANRALRMLIYSGNDSADLTTLSWDSGDQTLSYAGATFGEVSFGAISSATGTIRIGRIRGDDAVQPLPAAPSGTINAGSDQANVEPGSTVTLTALQTGGSGSNYGWTQTSGPAVTLGGSSTSATRTFVAPALQTGATLTFRASYGTATDDVSVSVLSHNHWIVRSGGLVARFPSRVS